MARNRSYPFEMDLVINDVDYLVQGWVWEGSPPITGGPPDRWDPGDPDVLEIDHVIMHPGPDEYLLAPEELAVFTDKYEEEIYGQWEG